MIAVIGKTSWVGNDDLAIVNRRAERDGKPTLKAEGSGDYFANLVGVWNMPLDEAVAYANLALSEARDERMRRARNIGEAQMTPREVRSQVEASIALRNEGAVFEPGDLIRRLKAARVTAHTVCEAMTLRELAWTMRKQDWLSAAHPGSTSDEPLLADAPMIVAEALWLTERALEIPSLSI